MTTRVIEGFRATPAEELHARVKRIISNRVRRGEKIISPLLLNVFKSTHEMARADESMV